MYTRKGCTDARVAEVVSKGSAGQASLHAMRQALINCSNIKPRLTGELEWKLGNDISEDILGSVRSKRKSEGAFPEPGA